jgi:hypothetical protein
VTLFTQRNEERLIIETLVTTHGAKVQFQRMRVTLSGEFPHKNHKIGLSGWNLACEGLLLGMRTGGHKDSNTEAHPRTRILMNLYFTITTAPHLHLFRRIESSCGGTLPRIGRRTPSAGGRSHRRSSPRRRPQDGYGSWRRSLVRAEVLVLDDVAWWTHATSSFVEHENICKSQRTVMTL